MSQARQTEILENITRKDRIKVINRDDYKLKTTEYATSQTATEFIPSPGAGYRLVLKYIAVRSDATANTAYITGTIDTATVVMAKMYFSRFKEISASDISVSLDENTSVKVTTTTGSDNVFIAVQYTIEEV